MNRTDTGPIPGSREWLFELPVSSEVSMELLLDWFVSALDTGGGLITFVNPRAWAVARHDPHYAQNLSEFDHVLPDGISVVLAARMLGLAPLHRLSFDSGSLALPIFELCRKMSLRVALIGGQPGIADRASKVIQESTGLNSICMVHDGYFQDLDALADKLTESRAQVLICGMGVPRQEETLLALRARGWQGVGFSCGGYLDQLSEGINYYPEWVNRLHLRAPYRLVREPGNLWRRCLLEYPVFGRLLFRQLITAGTIKAPPEPGA